MKAVEAYDEIKSAAEINHKLRDGQPQMFPEAASVGDYFPQGDVYIYLRDTMPNDVVTIDPSKNLQLAPGNSQGSRHILDSSDGVLMYQRRSPTELQGPWIVLSKTRTLTHPEHDHVILPAGTYEITYQRKNAEELRRVLD